MGLGKHMVATCFRLVTRSPTRLGCRVCGLTFSRCSYTCLNTQISQVFTYVNTTLRSCSHTLTLDIHGYPWISTDYPWIFLPAPYRYDLIARLMGR